MQDAHGGDGSSQLLENALTKRVIGAFYDVYNAMGPGFLESVYSNALLMALPRSLTSGRSALQSAARINRPSSEFVA